MSPIYGGEMGAVMITGASVFGLLCAAAIGYAVWMFSFDERIQANDDEAKRCRKNIAVARRNMGALIAAGLVPVFLAYLFTLFRVGNATRDDGVTVNYGYFAFISIAWFFLALLHSIYFWFEGNVLRILLGALWTGSMVMLAVGPLFHPHVKRELVFALAVVIQALSLLYIFWFEGVNGPLKRSRGWVAAAGVIAAFVLYDTFWFIGYLNETSSAVIVHTPWKSHLPFFFADICAFVVSVGLAMWLHRPKKMQPTVSATAAEMGSSGYGELPVQDAAGY